MDDHRWRAAAALASQHRDLITRSQANSCGLSDDAIRRAVRRGAWCRLQHGVFWTRPSSSLDVDTQVAAARLAVRGGTVGGHSAARLWELAGARRERPELILDPADTREQPRGIRLSWRQLAPEDRCEHRGVPVTTPARTLVDLARREPLRLVVPLIDDALRRRLIEPGDLCGLATRARRGGAAFSLADARAESPFESTVRVELTLAGLHPEALQYNVYGESGRWLARADLAWPSRLLIVELDGFETHGTPEALGADLRRQNALVAAGWTVLRFAWTDRGNVVPAVRAALARTAA
ncbi:MAG TPA: type IV toxin-antitoxin system AbiEi family antitoxin domain-containing protein [Mycobacteriales bacterium]|jgi:hypothetical protein|nr:type IV toxin-antitoxin system AbiEi family antitoxin domain-containing protein [Mycobacteriales bacterium]